MNRKKQGRGGFEIPSKYILLAISILCLVMMVLSYTTNLLDGPLETAAGYTVVPFQVGIEKAGRFLTSKSDNLREIDALNRQNEELKEKLDELTIENNELLQDKYELSELRQLYKLDEQYADYEKTGARVIGKDTGNWFSSFLIDKGSNDGIEVDMNVIAGSGLVGLITQVGPNWATVKSIIDDDSNLSGMVQNTSDTCIVSGSLKLMDQGYISFSQLVDSDDSIAEGDQIVTSYISDKYLPGISVGYITRIDKDANNLTKSGYMTPVVDFRHLKTVLVITELKQQKD